MPLPIIGISFFAGCPVPGSAIAGSIAGERGLRGVIEPGARDDRQRPSVSVIIPVHNRADMIKRAVSSVMGQTFGDWELIVVDDGSDEDIASALKAFDDPRISLIRLTKNSGAPVARNTGVDTARGDVVAFLDSDDEWLTEKLETQLAAMTSSVGAVLSGFVEEANGSLTLMVPPEGPISTERLLGGPTPWITTSQLMMRTTAARELRFDEDLLAYQDWDLLLRLGKAHTIVGIPDVLMIKHGHRGRRVYAGHRRHRALIAVSDKHAGEIAAREDIDCRWRVRRALAHWQLGEFGATEEVLRQAVVDHPDSLDVRWLSVATRGGPRGFAVFLRIRYGLRRLRRISRGRKKAPVAPDAGRPGEGEERSLRH